MNQVCQKKAGKEEKLVVVEKRREENHVEKLINDVAVKKGKCEKIKKLGNGNKKGRGANICLMFSDPNTKKDAITIAMNRAIKARRYIPQGRRVGIRVAQAEAHHYCPEMNDWNDNYKCNLNQGSCALIKTPEAKKGHKR